MSKFKGPKEGIFKKLYQKFFGKDQEKQGACEKHTVLENIPMKNLKLEPIEQQDENKEPDIEIAFINPETGELEILNLPQDMFQVKVSEEETEDEHIVTLELQSPSKKIEKEEDPYSKITHFPPSSRLH